MAASDSLPKAWEEAAKLGLPLSAEDVSHAPVPAERNSAPILSEYVLKGRSFNRGRYEELANARNFRQLDDDLAQTPALAIADRVAGMEYAPSRDYDLGLAVNYRELLGLRESARILSFRALARANRKDVSGAIEDLKKMHSLSLHAQSEASLVGARILENMEKMRFKAAQKAAEMFSTNPKALDRLQEELAPTVAIDLQHSLKGALYSWVSLLRSSNEAELEAQFAKEGLEWTTYPPPAQIVRTGLPKSPLARANLAKLLTTFSSVWPQLGSAKGDLAKQIAIYEGLSLKDLPEDPSNAATAGMSVRGGLDDLLVPLADDALTRALLKALTAKVKTGKFPNSLAEIDPFSGKPLGYRREGQGFLVWSVGRDRTDHQGKAEEEIKRAGEKFDRVLRYQPSDLLR